MKKRMLSLLILLCMVVGLIPSALAQGQGTAGDPILISSYEELVAFRDTVNNGNKYSGKHIKLVADIDLGGSDTPWIPIANLSNKPFEGNFDGRGHWITGLYISSGDGKAKGLFGYNDGTVRNLCVEGSVNGSGSTGAIAGINGGLVENCLGKADVSSSITAGGIVGYNETYGTVSSCVNTGNVSGSVDAGGIVGCNYGMLVNSGNTGDVSGSQYTGGVVGYECGEKVGSTANCYSRGIVTGGASVGGVAGDQPLSDDEYQNRIVNCYYLSDSSSAAGHYGSGLSRESFKNSGSFRGFNFTDIWTMDEKFEAPIPKGVYAMISGNPTEGSTYYFDLSGAGLAGELNPALPDGSLHYVPFTYVGRIDAYSLSEKTVTTEEYANANSSLRSLFVSDYNIYLSVTWNDLNALGLIFGKIIENGNIGYTLRVPSGGSESNWKTVESGDNTRGIPTNNEWDRILDKGITVKNLVELGHLSQDSSLSFIDHATARALHYNARTFSNISYGRNDYGYRPVLDIQQWASLGANGLKEVKLELNGGSVNDEGTIYTVVKKGSAFKAPVCEGLSAPEGYTAAGFAWLGSDGNTYAPGAEVPAEVTSLSAQWVYFERFTLSAGGTYYFDLSALGLPSDRINGELPDTSLSYVPFTFAGTVYADGVSGGKYTHTLLIADYNVLTGVSYKDLAFDIGAIGGKTANLNGVAYIMRVPTVGRRGTDSSEWDKILSKGITIKNTGIGSLGSETDEGSPGQGGEDVAIIRGGSSAGSREYVNSVDGFGYRPVLVIADEESLGGDTLKAVTLNLAGGSLGGESVINILVANGAEFTAPSAAALTRPEGNTEDYFKWEDSEGNVYEPGSKIPATVTALTAKWSRSQYTVTYDPGAEGIGETVTDSKTEGGYIILRGASFTRLGYTQVGWALADGAEMAYSLESVYSADESVTLYPVWRENDHYTVHLVNRDGTEVASYENVKWTDLLWDVVNPRPLKDGYAKLQRMYFGSKRADGSTMYKDFAANGEESITLIAVWDYYPDGMPCTIGVGSHVFSGYRGAGDDVGVYYFRGDELITINPKYPEEITHMFIGACDKLFDSSTDALHWIDYNAAEYTAPVRVSDLLAEDKEYILFVDYYDYASRVVVINTEKLVLDKTAPAFAGIENGKTYCGAQRVTVEEKHLESVTVNGARVELGADNSFTLAPAGGRQTVVATDKAGNVTQITVTVNDSHTGGIATCTKKAVCEICGEEYGELNPENHTGEEVWEHTETTHTKKWNCCGKVTVAEADHEFENGVCTVCAYSCTHKDENTDHKCDICSETVSNHSDENYDHLCDICGKSISNHADDDNNHICDLCGKAVSNHIDSNKDHICDICGKAVSNHVDDNTDHICDICGKTISNHIDDDNNHLCDTCGKAVSNHVDSNNDHVCDICGKAISNHVDENNNHICDICGKAITNHVDENNNHVCDICGKTVSNHVDSNNDHVCDICGKAVSNHVDDDNNHICDLCGKTVSNHSDENHDHVCDICGETISTHTGGTATCTKKAVCEICGEAYGELNPENHTGGTHIKHEKAATCTEKGYTGDTYCNGCNEKIADGSEIPTKPHTPGEKWVIENGKKVKKCTECGAIAETAPRMPGDVDGDGEITMLDCLYLKRYILGTYNGEIVLENADVDGNGRIDATDYLYLKRGYLGTFDLSKFA